MTEQIYVSIVIPSYNCQEILGKCLKAVRANKTNYRYEILVLDAGSTDKTCEIARKYADKVITGIPNKINRNLGIDNAAGEILCFTDSDCITPEQWIQLLVDNLLKKYAQDNKSVGVGGDSNLCYGDLSLIEKSINRAIASPLVSFKARNLASYDTEREVLHNPPMNSAYFKWALERVGGFQEEHGYGGEDLELDAKLTEQGYKLWYIPLLSVDHAHRAGYKKFFRQMHSHGKARVRVGLKYKKYLQFHHCGPLFLCLMAFTPLIVIPLMMSLINSIYVSFKCHDIRLLFPIIFFTMSFYISYGSGEIIQLFRSMR